MGSVAEFDDARGLGVIEASDGVRYPFHCTAIADGTRTIEVGTTVEFQVRPATMGRWEAAQISSR